MTQLMDPKIDQRYPIIPIRDGVVFPGTEVVLTFGREKSIAAIESAASFNKQVVLVMQKTANNNNPNPEDLYRIGTKATIERMFKHDGEINALVKGISRVEILAYDKTEPYLLGRISPIPDTGDITDQVTALSNHILSELRKAVNLGKAVDFLIFMNIMSSPPIGELVNQVANILEIKPQEKQGLLEMNDVKTRMEQVDGLLSHEVKILELEKRISSKTQERFDKNIRDSVLRERLKTIEKELGEEENREFKELSDKIKAAKMPQEVFKKAEKELKRLTQMSQYNPETSYVRTYLEWLTDLPWVNEIQTNIDISKAQKILDTDHYGLKKIKERIIEYLAVIKLKISKEKKIQEKESTLKKENVPAKQKISHPTILCFVGPPGVGKTSLGKSIARALGRKFVKISLGGIRDEAEIRGHRRTYVGALPGRIIQGIKQAGSNDPVFMMDEVDKIGTDFRGDPSAALLEALDPEQNNAFSDHYLEVPYDLSNVFFITTCNVLDTVPPALRDRLEIIHFPGYTEDEKFHIAQGYLVDKQLSINGLEKDQAEIKDSALHNIIENYTREAGVRSLEREISTVLRKIAKEVAEGKKAKTLVKTSDLQKYLGPAKFTAYLAEKKNEIGMTTGLAWTEAGGDILFIEVALMPGKGLLTLTGHLGDVMKESCQAAMSYVRSRWQHLGLPEKFFQTLDVHVHVPEGAVPKDGPSAGIAITTAIVSALTKIPVKRIVSMTGEVTLRGRALEIGGVKEKVIAAHRAGIKTVILPKNNKKDLEDIPKQILKDLQFVFVENVDEVLKVALTKPLPHLK
ncbi:MAG: Lon protease [Candidatus Gottesmanbacteria bacterium GW2011_GWA1_34_13]|uniref:Lon protease n=1 Tax=Candidatus Gottesmanbacteria bacterium GW2011_GWA1_34_13 TaxID=1618434 RepID=A0A0G0DRL9_9BACT|nr:MAG: Lon protease [Candidatus Gottesmanbacteria bacterium GW2011_GWA1_34_13]